jgi:hydrogenase nickel incorporation protein HypA/HybF
MHEVGITMTVLETVLTTLNDYKQNKATDVYLRVGQLRGIEPEVMRFCWETVSKDTVAEGACLHIDLVPAKGFCEGCRCVFDASDLMFVCPQCDGGNVKTHQGNELVLDRVVMTEPEAHIAQVGVI